MALALSFASASNALDLKPYDLIYSEDFEGESTYQTTPETDLLSLGEPIFFPGVTLDGSAAHFSVPVDDPNSSSPRLIIVGPNLLGIGDLGLRARIDSWIFSPAATGTPGWVYIAAQFDSSPSSFVQLMLFDNTSGVGIALGSSLFELTTLPLPANATAAVRAGTPFTLDLYVSSAYGWMIGSVAIDGVGVFQTSAYDLSVGAAGVSAIGVVGKNANFSGNGNDLEFDLEKLQVFTPSRPPDFGMRVAGVQKVSDASGYLSGPGNPGTDPGGVLANGDGFGFAFAAPGDVDADGIPDLFVGAPFDHDLTIHNTGALYVLRMNADGTVKGRQKFSAGNTFLAAALAAQGYSLVGNSRFGSSIAYLGALGPRGVVVVGAPQDSVLQFQQGAVYVVFPTKWTLPEVDSVVKIGDGLGGFPSGQLAANDWFGSALAAIGDLDGDGISELAVGAEGADAVWILFIALDGTVKSSPPPMRIDSPDGSDSFGASVAALGDFDGDGTPDIAVGAPLSSVPGVIAGAVWIITLDTDGSALDLTLIRNDAGGLPNILIPNGNFGGSLSALSDLDGNGTRELLVGESNATAGAGQLARGRALVLFLEQDTNPLTGPVMHQVEISATTSSTLAGVDANDLFGRGVVSIGDLDGDGVDDWAIGASGDDDGGADRGALYVLFPEVDAPPVHVPTIGAGGLLGLALGLLALGARAIRLRQGSPAFRRL